MSSATVSVNFKPPPDQASPTFDHSSADFWHLYNDGGDSLNVTLPAGTYGLASIDINREITITTITSDGTTPINTLRHERQLDVILRAGAFTYGEEQAIRDYWGRVFA